MRGTRSLTCPAQPHRPAAEGRTCSTSCDNRSRLLGTSSSRSSESEARRTTGDRQTDVRTARTSRSQRQNRLHGARRSWDCRRNDARDIPDAQVELRAGQINDPKIAEQDGIRCSHGVALCAFLKLAIEALSVGHDTIWYVQYVSRTEGLHSQQWGGMSLHWPRLEEQNDAADAHAA